MTASRQRPTAINWHRAARAVPVKEARPAQEAAQQRALTLTATTAGRRFAFCRLPCSVGSAPFSTAINEVHTVWRILFALSAQYVFFAVSSLQILQSPSEGDKSWHIQRTMTLSWPARILGSVSSHGVRAGPKCLLCLLFLPCSGSRPWALFLLFALSACLFLSLKTFASRRPAMLRPFLVASWQSNLRLLTSVFIFGYQRIFGQGQGRVGGICLTTCVQYVSIYRKSEMPVMFWVDGYGCIYFWRIVILLCLLQWQQRGQAQNSRCSRANGKSTR